jgi:hypothetical protein
MTIHPLSCLVAAGILSGLAGGAYVVAAATATAMAGTLTTTESELHARRTDAESSLRRASARYAAARGECETFKRVKRELCNAAARADEKQSILRDSSTKETAP